MITIISVVIIIAATI